MTKILKIGNCDLIVKGAKAVLTGLYDAMARTSFNNNNYWLFTTH